MLDRATLVRSIRGGWLLVFAGACAAGNVNTASEPPPNIEIIKVRVGERTFDITRQDNVSTVELQTTPGHAWAALLQSFEQLGIPMLSVDQKAGTAVFLQKDKTTLDGKRVSTYVDCGTTLTGPRADVYSVTIKVSAALESLGPERTRVHTVVRAWAKSGTQATNTVPCESTQVLERRIVELLATYAQ